MAALGARGGGDLISGAALQLVADKLKKKNPKDVVAATQTPVARRRTSCCQCQSMKVNIFLFLSQDPLPDVQHVTLWTFAARRRLLR